MKQIRKAFALSLASAVLFLGVGCSDGVKIKSLEEEVGRNKLKIEYLEKNGDFYRRQLIKHGNPEGWKLNGDSLGNCWYERDTDGGGDGIGGYGTEYLDIDWTGKE